MRERIDYFSDYVKDAIKQLKKGGKVYLSNKEQLKEIQKQYNVEVVKEDEYFITVRLIKE